MKVLIGTKNPGKIEGAKKAFETYFEDVEVEGIDVESEVSAQPVNEEIFQGAKNRVKNVKKYAKEHNIEADFYIASEGGMTNLLCNEWLDFNAVVVEDKNGFSSIGSSQGFQIPDKYVEEIKNTELGKVFDRLFNTKEINKGKGGIDFLTHHQMTRIDLVKSSFITALASHINGDLWK